MTDDDRSRRKNAKKTRAAGRLDKSRRRLASVLTPQPLDGWQADARANLAGRDIMVVSGPPGTGKTHLAVRLAVEQYTRGRVRKIYVVRPAVEAGEHLGFLPGDILQKLGPFLAPVFEALKTFGLSGEELIRQGALEVVPVAYLKGRTLDGFVILDEAQDCTSRQLRLVLSRLGEHGQMVVTGDPDQSDCPETPNAFKVFCDKLWMGDHDGYAVFRLAVTDIRRHRLVAKLLDYCKDSK